MNIDDVFFQQDKPPRADAIRNRTLLLDTAQRLFEEQGVESVTMSAIAQEAQVGKGTLYRHFADKAELCHAMLDEAMRSLQEQTLGQLRQLFSTRSKLGWFMQQAAQFSLRNADLLAEAARQGEGSMLTHPAHRWWWQTIRALLDQDMAQGDRDFLADTLYVMLDARVLSHQRSKGYDSERILAGLDEVLQRLLGA